MERREPSQHSLLDPGKPRKICVEMAGLRTFRILTYTQLSGIKLKAVIRPKYNNLYIVMIQFGYNCVKTTFPSESSSQTAVRNVEVQQIIFWRRVILCLETEEFPTVTMYHFIERPCLRLPRRYSTDKYSLPLCIIHYLK